jgi:hypothetical protein
MIWCYRAARRPKGEAVAIRRILIRRILLAAALWALASAETRAGEFIVEIDGTQGTSFGGTCLVTTADQFKNHAASGSVPLTLEFPGDSISCAIQRKSGSGDLHMVIKIPGGRVVAETSEMLPFGVLLAAGR